MQIEHTSNYGLVIFFADINNATKVSFQYHAFVNFNRRKDAENFKQSLEKYEGLSVGKINTNRPGVPFEVIVHRWK